MWRRPAGYGVGRGPRFLLSNRHGRARGLLAARKWVLAQHLLKSGKNASFFFSRRRGRRFDGGHWSRLYLDRNEWIWLSLLCAATRSLPRLTLFLGPLS